MSFRERLGEELLFFDGAMGTMMQRAGLKPGENGELWNILYPERVCAIHKAYVEAGCHIVKTNTFGANRLKQADSGYSVEEIVRAAVSLARKAAGPDGLVALDLGPCGKLLKPLGDLDFEDAVSVFAEIVDAGKDRADLILIETMSDTYEIKAAVLAARENSDLPVVVTVTPDENGRLLTGGDPASVVCLLEGLGVDALGLNCGFGPEQMKPHFEAMALAASIPLAVNPNAGLPETEDGRTVYRLTPENFAEIMEQLVEDGAWLIGGCCGTTPDHIRAMAKRCKGMALRPRIPRRKTWVSSYTKAVEFGKKPILIGERINPTGKPRLKQALREKDMEYLYREGIDQAENGADILDVNVGLPGIDEPAVMAAAVEGLQAVLDIPLQIDTSDLRAMERALRRYNGKPLINSVNGKEETMAAVFPLAKKYGGVLIALTLDESGIPKTAQGRIAIAEKIIARAKEYGIEKENIVVDTLAMTVSTGAENAEAALDALAYVRGTLGVHTSLGVSNISFGLPARDLVNGTFFAMALTKGLSAGIVNPASASIMNAHDAYCVLTGVDAGCRSYVEKYADTAAGPEKVSVKTSSESRVQEPAGEDALRRAIVKGLKEQAFTIALEMAKEQEPVSIIHNCLVPALDEVGKGFEEKKLFLPQLLMSADAAREAFEALKRHMLSEGAAEEKKGKILLATVKGDIHDIGKNIVKVLLENYGYDVIDLGKDVPPETIVETVREERIPLVGLSALMTTTVDNMEETIALLRKETDCRVLVGGAVLTEGYAKKIGADYYAKDAMESVRYAERLFAGKKS
ncbi:MAG: dihydropteroate synthase [Lachnospiraceae bacterium]|nr:dihydropteroate synthase [Lachnospiraceae bacterium]